MNASLQMHAAQSETARRGVPPHRFGDHARGRQRLAGSASLGRIGSLEVRLARSAREVKAAQALRYRVFYEEMSARADETARATRRDSDGFDPLCDHLVVLDHEPPGQHPCGADPRVVGTYRLLPKDLADAHGGFYTAGKFDLAPLFERHPTLRFLELGRSCVLPSYRSRRTVALLWHGVWAYCLERGIDVMLGCGSLEGTDPARLAPELSFLHHFARAGDDWRVRPLAGCGVSMNRLPKAIVDRRSALAALPPLMKGYLRLGAKTGDGAVIDRQFGTTVVLVILPVASISSRYVNRFGAPAERRLP